MALEGVDGAVGAPPCWPTILVQHGDVVDPVASDSVEVSGDHQPAAVARECEDRAVDSGQQVPLAAVPHADRRHGSRFGGSQKFSRGQETRFISEQSAWTGHQLDASDGEGNPAAVFQANSPV